MDETQALVEGLKLRPDSMYRATSFTANPPRVDDSAETQRQLGWFGWDQTAALLLDIRNLLAPKQRLQPPPSATGEEPTSGIEMLQQLRVR